MIDLKFNSFGLHGHLYRQAEIFGWIIIWYEFYTPIKVLRLSRLPTKSSSTKKYVDVLSFSTRNFLLAKKAHAGVDKLMIALLTVLLNASSKVFSSSKRKLQIEKMKNIVEELRLGSQISPRLKMLSCRNLESNVVVSVIVAAYPLFVFAVQFL